MNIAQIIQQLKAERSRLDAAIALLQGRGETMRTGGRHMSPAARARIAEGQRRRWAERKASSATAAPSTSRAATAKPRGGRRHMSAAARARIADAQKARWARVKAQKKK